MRNKYKEYKFVSGCNSENKETYISVDGHGGFCDLYLRFEEGDPTKVVLDYFTDDEEVVDIPVCEVPGLVLKDFITTNTADKIEMNSNQYHMSIENTDNGMKIGLKDGNKELTEIRIGCTSDNVEIEIDEQPIATVIRENEDYPAYIR